MRGTLEEDDDFEQEGKELSRRIQENRSQIERLLKLYEEDKDHKREEPLGNFYPALEKTDTEEPGKELDLHDYFSEKSQQRSSEKVLISQSTSTSSTTDSSGITRTKRVRERRYSDGSIEREEHDDEMGPNDRHRPIIRKDELRNSIGLAGKKEEIMRAFQEERKKIEAAAPVAQMPTTSPSKGWRSWLWASEK